MKFQVFLSATAIGLAFAGCSAAPEPATGEQAGELTGATSAERGIHFEGRVYVDLGAPDSVIGVAIARQVKTALGALRDVKVSLNDRAARANIDPAKWRRTEVDVVDGAGVKLARKLQVTYRYDDRAVVTNDLTSRSGVDFVLLADDYTAHADPLKIDCSDDATTDADSLWYHFKPQMAACRARIASEGNAITAAAAKLQPGTVSIAELNRWFLPVTAKLDAAKAGSAAAPEYDRLYGVGTDKSKLVVYAFFGVDKDENDPDDNLGIEAARFTRSMLRSRPNLRPVRTEPFAWLLDFQVDGKKLDGVTYDQALTWVVDKTNYPAAVGTDVAKIRNLRQQVVQKLAERWIYWALPVTVKDAAGKEKTVTVELRTFYGYEDGNEQHKQHAQWRYQEAFWHGDVFLYNGHSHFGHGPLEPTRYAAGNWNDRYQIMLVNSCISFNYYQKDFLDMKPGGSKNLETIVNGLPSWVWGGGEVLARFVNGIIGAKSSYGDLLQSMRLDTPWGERGYDPMRVVDGELDNQYAPAKVPLVIKDVGPVYP
jgi:hypothetical protein